MVQKNSLEAFKAKSMIIDGYYDYLDFKRLFLPSLSLNMQPLIYSNELEQVFTGEQMEYKVVQNITNYGEFSLSQPIKSLGGDLRFNSSLRRYQSFVEDMESITNYISTPAGIKY